MRLTKRMSIGLLILFVIISLAILMMWKIQAPNEKVEMTEMVETKIDERDIAALSDTESNYLKVDTFIRERVPAVDIFLEFELVDENLEPPTLEELRKEFFNMFYAAVKTQNMDLFTIVFSGESIQDIWGSELIIEKRIELMENFLANISRGGKLTTISYQFEKDKNDFTTNKGTFYMIFDDDVEVPIPFELVLIEDDEERYFQFFNTVIEIERHLLNKK